MISFILKFPELVVKIIWVCIAVTGKIDLELSASFPRRMPPPIQITGTIKISNWV